MAALAVGAGLSLLSMVGLAQCSTDPQYAEACSLEGGTARWVAGSSPARGYCDHPDGYGSQGEIDVCVWILTERGHPNPSSVCTFVASESSTWMQL